MVHGECGDGELALALMAAGLPCGAEPRRAVAWRAAERGVDVHLGPVPRSCWPSVPAGTLGGVVLSGVVDRLTVEDLVALLALATDRLGEGAPLVVVGTA